MNQNLTSSLKLIIYNEQVRLAQEHISELGCEI